LKSLNNPEGKKLLCVGRITAAHGIHGAVRMVSYAASSHIFEPGASIAEKKPGRGWSTLRIVWAKPHRKGLRIQFDGVENRFQAEGLVGSEIFIEASRLPVLEEDEYYWHELMGLAVITGDHRHLGRIASIIDTGSNDVYVVQGEENEILVPALASVVRDIDVAAGRMTVELPEGLSEITTTPGRNG
jgi:16S rRNA processing protein RimM